MDANVFESLFESLQETWESFPLESPITKSNPSPSSQFSAKSAQGPKANSKGVCGGGTPHHGKDGGVGGQGPLPLPPQKYIF